MTLNDKIASLKRAANNYNLPDDIEAIIDGLTFEETDLDKKCEKAITQKTCEGFLSFKEKFSEYLSGYVDGVITAKDQMENIIDCLVYEAKNKG